MENRTQLLDSFLQVTINSNKLMQTLDKMSRQINQHATQIKILRQVIPTIKQSVYTSLQTSQARMKLDVQRNTLKIKEQLKLMKLHLDSLDSEISKVNINCEKKMKEKDQQVSFLDEQKKRIQSIINLYEQNRMNAQTKINQQIWSIKQTLERVLREFTQYDNKTDDKFQVMFLKIQSMIKKINVNQRTCEDSQPTSRKERSSVAPKIYPKATKISNISNWASFSAKISQFQKKNTQKQQNPSYLNKVLYSKKIESQQDISSAEHNDSGFSLDQSIIDKSNIQGIKSLFKQYNLQIQKNLESLKNKIIVQDQKLGINVRKIEKLTQNQNQYKISLMKFSQKRPQQQSLQVLRNQLKKTHLQIMQEVEKKVNQTNFQREKNKILQKISILHQNLIQKADKGDMKKAFMFMQQKIKQIIILIASDQNQQKNGAIKKIPVKCLSCDKGLQLDSVTTPHRLASPLTSRQNEPNLKTATRKIRSRIQISNQISCQTSLTNL